MAEGFLTGCLVGMVFMAVLLIVGLWVAQILDRSGREKEIQARLTHVLSKIEENEAILQQTLDENSKLASDFRFMSQICGTAIESALVYFEQNPVIWGEKNRDKIVAELHEALHYAGKERVTPLALLEHHLTNGGMNEQSTVS